MTESATEPQEPTTNPTSAQPGVQGEPGFKPITSEAELSAWKDGVRKSIVADVRKQLQDEQAEKDAKAKADAENKAAVERGEAEKVIAEKDQAIADKDARIADLEAKVAKAEESAAKRVETLKAELPDEAMGGYPDDADATTQEAWLVERAELVSKLAPAAANGNGHPRVPATPAPQGNVKPEATSLVSRHAI